MASNMGLASTSDPITSETLIMSDTRVKDALAFSQQLLNRYERARNLNKTSYYGAQAAIIILSGITPLLLLLKLPPIVAAVPPATASIAAGLANSFRYRERYVTSKVTFEELKFEHTKFELGLAPYVREKVEGEKSKDIVDIFIRNLEILHKRRMEEWRELQQESQSPEKVINDSR